MSDGRTWGSYIVPCTRACGLSALDRLYLHGCGLRVLYDAFDGESLRQAADGERRWLSVATAAVVQSMCRYLSRVCGVGPEVEGLVSDPAHLSDGAIAPQAHMTIVQSHVST